MAKQKKGTAVVTGALGGIGYELAKLSAQNGYDLVLAARSEDKLNKIKTDFEAQYNIKVHVYIRNKPNHKEHYSVKLEHGSFLLMKAGLQEGCEHRLAKSAKPMSARINLTFRLVI